MKLTYKTSFASVVGSLTVAKFMAPLAFASPMGVLAGGVGLSLVGIFGMNKGQMSI